MHTAVTVNLFYLNAVSCIKNNILTGNPIGKGILGRPTRRWEDNNKMGINTSNWVDSAQPVVYEAEAKNVLS